VVLFTGQPGIREKISGKNSTDFYASRCGIFTTTGIATQDQRKNIIHAHKQKLMDAEQFANWLMDISDELNSIAQEIEVDAESYFVFTYEIEADAEFENRQDFSEKKAAYLERLLRQIPERIKKADQLATG
jgi:uncharacterized protein YukE